MIERSFYLRTLKGIIFWSEPVRYSICRVASLNHSTLSAKSVHALTVCNVLRRPTPWISELRIIWKNQHERQILLQWKGRERYLLHWLASLIWSPNLQTDGGKRLKRTEGKSPLAIWKWTGIYSIPFCEINRQVQRFLSDWNGYEPLQAFSFLFSTQFNTWRKLILYAPDRLCCISRRSLKPQPWDSVKCR